MHVLAPIVLLEGSQVMHEELVVVNPKYKHKIVEEYLNLLQSKNVTLAATRSGNTYLLVHTNSWHVESGSPFFRVLSWYYMGQPPTPTMTNSTLYVLDALINKVPKVFLLASKTERNST